MATRQQGKEVGEEERMGERAREKANREWDKPERAATSTTPGAPVPTLQRRRKRKRSRSALPENYTFVPLSG
eukprot:scaffold60079_cov55-Attheya_sp.AAC.1